MYYTTCEVPPAVREELGWWVRILADDRGRQARSDRSSTLVPTWGDGSGTGTGGTILLPDAPLHLWMGQWTPTVHSFSSNWKELKTLLLTLQQVSANAPGQVEGTTMFYFTDNAVTYYITSSGSSRSPGLHDLIKQIQLLTLDLRCFLHVVHVPGVVMIDQGTDGLSRGVWLSDLHPERNQTELTRAVFDPFPVDMVLADEYIRGFGLLGSPRLHHWGHPWGASLFGHLSVWFPPPELARQCLIGILEAWVEQPLNTSALLFIPRTLSGCWVGLSRHIILLDTIYPSKRALRHPPVLPIPILVLYLGPHQRVLPSSSHRLGSPTKPCHYKWHQQEATRVRELSHQGSSQG